MTIVIGRVSFGAWCYGRRYG